METALVEFTLDDWHVVIKALDSLSINDARAIPLRHAVEQRVANRKRELESRSEYAADSYHVYKVHQGG